MEKPEQVTVDDRAFLGWSLLPDAARARIMESLAGLAGRPPEQWPEGEVERWWPHDDLYALHAWVGPDELLVFFRPEGDRIRIDGMLLKETIERYSVKKS